MVTFKQNLRPRKMSHWKIKLRHVQLFQPVKPRTHDQITHRFRLRCALLPAIGTGRFDVARGLIRASVVSRLVAVNSSNIKDARSERRDPFLWPVVFCTLSSRPSFLAVSKGLWSRIPN
ncbi:hypothetical protein AVEN_52470-1 [Araneus ventricosus]|uniref:Uncharacterized protein n=1 Tax=Araneus ventricosus TaxID=182803 RepID=A0A4Y2CZB8_ARAVE|nr:hypothetical protein AVEN_52470-1 [Araneus ventricosus]